MSRPAEGDFGEFYRHYISLASGENVTDLIAVHSPFISDYISHIPEDKGSYTYAEGKWTIRQLIQHMLDTERIFVYRLLCLARGDLRPLSGFDENAFAAAAPASHRNFQDIRSEILLLRRSTDLLIASLTVDELKQKGEASGSPATVNALCFMIYGHSLHHIQILKERYSLK
jgi:hypothetical protein